MEQLGANTLSEALNYTAGVRSDIYGSDSRYDWLSIRGFDAYFPGFYFDGLFARNNNTWADAKNVYTDFSAGAPIRNASVQTDEAFTWRGGLVYLFNNGLAPYFSYSQAFEPVIGLDRLNAPFEPTTAEQYEAGVKFQPKGKQSFVTLSAFDITRANVLMPDPIDPNESIQTGEVTSQGFEAEATLDLSNGWKSIATYTYTYAIVTDSNDPAEIGTYFEAVPLNWPRSGCSTSFSTGA